MMENINQLMNKQRSSHPKEETVTPSTSTNMESSDNDSDLEINIVDVMDNGNQLDHND